MEPNNFQQQRNQPFRRGDDDEIIIPEWTPPAYDDGTMACLNIPPDPKAEFFECGETNQKLLKGMEFYVIDFQKQRTEYGNKYVVKIKFDLNDPEENAKKFFTGNRKTKYRLEFMKYYNMLPRKVKMKGDDKSYWIE
ncbi:MAG: hypothetical protein K5885_06660 [Bacteroidales bacterium]|nr:hypothetical protein [Bacteroidales bacterium]